MKNYSVTSFKSPMVAPNDHNGYQTYHESSTYASYNIISPNENTAENIEICFGLCTINYYFHLMKLFMYAKIFTVNSF